MVTERGIVIIRSYFKIVPNSHSLKNKAEPRPPNIVSEMSFGDVITMWGSPLLKTREITRKLMDEFKNCTSFRDTLAKMQCGQTLEMVYIPGASEKG